MLGPLRQRLELYGFASVQIDPRQPLQPWQWQLQGLEAATRSLAWESLLFRCLPFSLNTNAPVISNSLAFLDRIRKKSPERWLIHCQTAFEKPLGRQSFRRLMIKKPLPFLHRMDAMTPLRWLPGLWHQKAVRITHYPRQHPQDLRLKTLQKRFPCHQFRCLEDGQLLVQLNLFGGKVQIPRGSGAAMSALDQAVRSQTGALNGGWLIASGERQRLNWFRRDLVRIWRGRYDFWDGELPAYPSVQGSMLVLVSDADLKWGLPHVEGWPMLHLDGDVRTLAYRHARQVPANPPSWVSNVPVIGQASWRWQGKTFWFQKTKLGWGNPGTEALSLDLSTDFSELLACFQVA